MNKLGRYIRRYFVAGLLVWVPIYISYFVVHFIVSLLDGTLALLPDKYHISGLGVIFTVVILLVTGILVTNFLGRRLLTIWEKLVSRIPLIRSIHSTTKQVVLAVAQPNGNAFKKVVVVPYPHANTWTIAFVTSSSLHGPWTSQELINVFVPTTPNPTSGFLLFVPAKDTIELDISVEEALRMVISLGVIHPEGLKRKEKIIVEEIHEPVELNAG